MKRSKKKLDETHSHLLKYWNYEKNTILPSEITYGSGRKVWWICIEDLSHPSYEQMISNKATHAHRCPYCAGQKLLYTNSLAVKFPRIAEEWDYDKNKITPSQIAGQSNKKAFWICKVNSEHTWMAVVCNRTTGNKGCPFCARQRVCSSNCLSSTHPQLVNEWNYEKNGEITPANIVSGNSKKVWWVCLINKKHPTYDVSPHTRTSLNVGCPYCANKKVCIDNCFATTHPDMANEWHIEKNSISPYDITYGTNKKVWWRCIKDPSHEWLTTPNNRVRFDSPCPFCNRGISKAQIAILAFVKLLHQDAYGPICGLLENKRYELDIYIPSLKIAIEYDGEFFHRSVWSKNNGSQRRDRRKNKLCKHAGIKLLRIREKHFLKDKEKAFQKIIKFIDNNRKCLK